jgi:Protein of unknown function (DUF2442)
MPHPIHAVREFDIVGPYTLHVRFTDGTSQIIDFHQVLEGEVFGPLRHVDLFNQVALDPEARTLVWPNGADFAPETLHDWPQLAGEMAAMAQGWARTSTPTRRAG